MGPLDTFLKIISYTLPAGRVFGIPLRVHWLLLLFLVFFIAPSVRAFQGVGSVPGLLIGLGMLLILYGSVLLHELGHAFGMRLVGERCEYILLTPIGGIAAGGGGNISPRTELLVVGLGPAVSLLLCILGFAAAWGMRLLGVQAIWATVVHGLLLYVGGLNLMLFLFNMFMPMFPLDGYKMLRALLCLRHAPSRTTHLMAQWGIVMAAIVFLASIFRVPLPIIGSVGPFLMIIAILGVQSSYYEMKAAEHGDIYATQDSWGGGKPVYYDNEVMASARRRLGLGVSTQESGEPRPAPRDRKPPAYAAPHRQAAGMAKRERPAARVLSAVDPDAIDDPEELGRLIREAANMEDFVMAKRLKARLEQVRKAGKKP